MNENSSYHRLPYTHEEIEALFAKLQGREALSAEDYEKLINVIGLDNISTFSGNYEDLKNLPDIPKHISDLLNDLEYQTADDVNRKILAVQENLMMLINEYENENELEYVKSTALDNVKDILEIKIDVKGDEIIKQISSTLAGYATKAQLNHKADITHNHQVTDINGLEARLQISEGMVDKLYDKHLEFVDKQHKHDNKEVIDKITQKKMDEWDNFLKTTDEKILLKADMDHNHDDRYADKDDEHNHWNLSVLNNINADTIENLNKRLFVAYHNGLDNEGNFLEKAPDRPIYDGNLNGWYSLTGDPAIDANVDLTKAVWMSHKIDTYIDEGVWSLPIKIVGRSIKNLKIQYYVSTSETECIGGEWIDYIPEDIGENYLWSRTVILWENPEGTTETLPIRQTLYDSIKNITDVQINIGNQINNIETSLNNFKQQATSEHNTLYTRVNELANEINTKNLELNDKIDTEIANITSDLENNYQKKSAMSNYSTTAQMNTAIKNESDAIKSNVASTYQTKDAMKDYTKTVDMNTIISTEFNSLKNYSDSTFQTKSAMSDYMTSSEVLGLFQSNEGNINNTLNNYVTKTDLSSYYNKTETSNLISQSANTITTNVANTYQTKSGMSSYSPTSHTHTAVNGITVSKMTQASYDAATKSSSTFYIIVG